MRIKLAYPLTLGKIASMLALPAPKAANRRILAITSNSAEVEPGDLFLALRGKSTDGHRYLPEAFLRGAAGAVTSTPCRGGLLVADTTLALGKLAQEYLKEHRIPVIAVTGSVGKTTAKDYIAAALSTRHTVHKTGGNENNEIGLPKSILSLEKNTTHLVLEMGMNREGEIAAHSRIARPDAAIITAIGTAHIAAFGSREGILAEKASILSGLQENGRVYLNGDEPLLRGFNTKTPPTLVSLEQNGSFRAAGIRVFADHSDFTLITPTSRHRAYLPHPGRPRILSALLAVAVAADHGVKPEEALSAIGRLPAVSGRGRVLRAGELLLIDDSYNASPESVTAALSLLSEIRLVGGRRIAVLGDMRELGEGASFYHRKVAHELFAHADLLFAFGEMAEEYERGAREGGMKAAQIRTFPQAEACAAALLSELRANDTVLIKASRALRGERILEALLAR